MSWKGQGARTCSAGRVATNGNSVWIAAKCVNVFTDPFECFRLVPKTQIPSKTFTPIWTESWNIRFLLMIDAFDGNWTKKSNNYQECRGDNQPLQAQFDDSRTSWSTIVCCKVVKIRVQSRRHERRRAPDIWRSTENIFLM